MPYRLQTWCFFMHESLKRDHEKESDEKKRKCEKPKIKKKNERASLRYCCVFQVIIYEEQ